jgi:hypothetical protein
VHSDCFIIFGLRHLEKNIHWKLIQNYEISFSINQCFSIISVFLFALSHIKLQHLISMTLESPIGPKRFCFKKGHFSQSFNNVVWKVVPLQALKIISLGQRHKGSLVAYDTRCVLHNGPAICIAPSMGMHGINT